MSELAGRRAVVRVPATSANLGPGFDAFGLCLGLYDDLAVTTTASGLAVAVSGEGADDVPTDEEHLVVRALRAALELMGAAQPGLSLATENRIPHGRGLGSSAAAIVAGIRLAQGLAAPEHELDDAAAFSLAHEIEGHPDNVAACLFGGLTIAWADQAGPSAARLEVDQQIRTTVLVPPHPLSTEVARAALPDQVPHRDAAENAGRAGLLVAAMTQQPELLLAASEDRLHQEYRGAAMPTTLELVTRLRARAVAATISGAGPTVLVLTTQDDAPEYADLVPHDWRAVDLLVDSAGCRWRPLG